LKTNFLPNTFDKRTSAFVSSSHFGGFFYAFFSRSALFGTISRLNDCQAKCGEYEAYL
jgi:hypothetical protein